MVGRVFYLRVHAIMLLLRVKCAALSIMLGMQYKYHAKFLTRVASNMARHD